MRNTTAESTAFGMYCNGTVRNSSTTTTITAVVSDASWLLPPAPSTICVFVGLPFTTNVPDRPAAAFARPRPTRSTFSSNASEYFAAYARDVAALCARITMKIAPAVPSKCWNCAPRDVGEPETRQSAGYGAERRHTVRHEIPVPARRRSRRRPR